MESNIEETWKYRRLPSWHHKQFKSTNLLGRFNQETKRSTPVVRIFPDEASCMQLIRAVAAEQHEEWPVGSRHENVEPLRERATAMKTDVLKAA